ncbi:MAG: HindVP family restriction endonuclease [Deinococcales bacterium]
MPNQHIVPRLFGLTKSNRDFSQKETWGKNQFNSAFPAALCCYLAAKSLEANYLCLSNGSFRTSLIAIADVFTLAPNHQDIYFAFEAQHSPYQKYVIGSLPRTDLVIQRESTGACLAGLEIKLTALPDHTTCELDEVAYGSELVIRPDSIAYLACSIASRFANLADILPSFHLNDWSDAQEMLEISQMIIISLEKLALELEQGQKAFLIQPIWKTLGKSAELAKQCLDVFVWSDAAFLSFISSIAQKDLMPKTINRQTRTAIWLYQMLKSISTMGKFNYAQIIDNLSYNTKNDKAFAPSGNITNRFMGCPRLLEPAIRKGEIKHIILGGGQQLLSPERRFDAIVFNSPDLFR